MVYTFARVGAAVAMKVEDFFVQGRRVGCGCMKNPHPNLLPRSTQANAERASTTSMPHDQANICGKARIELT